MTLHTYNPQPMSLPSINFLHLMVVKIQPGQEIIGQGHYAKVRGHIKSHHDIAHLQSSTNVPTKYQLPTHYDCQNTARTRYYWSRSLCQSMMLHTSTPNQCLYQVSTFYTLWFIAQTIFDRWRSLWQGQRSNQGHTMTLLTYNP